VPYITHVYAASLIRYRKSEIFSNLVAVKRNMEKDIFIKDFSPLYDMRGCVEATFPVALCSDA